MSSAGCGDEQAGDGDAPAQPRGHVLAAQDCDDVEPGEALGGQQSRDDAADHRCEHDDEHGQPWDVERSVELARPGLPQPPNDEPRPADAADEGNRGGTDPEDERLPEHGAPQLFAVRAVARGEGQGAPLPGRADGEGGTGEQAGQ